MIDWCLYLARYHRTRGGYFFCGDDLESDAQLILLQEEKPPILVCLRDVPAGRGSYVALTARTMVRLEGSYTLKIGPRSLVGAGVSGVAGLLGKGMDFGYPEATRDRAITTNRRAFTKLVLGDLALRNGLTEREKDYLRVYPTPLEDGWHTVEAGPTGLDGGLRGNSPWVSRGMNDDYSYMSPEDREAVRQAGSQAFDGQLDGLLDLLRAARGAVTAWPMPREE